MAGKFTKDAIEALNMMNADFNTSWTFGTNWDSSKVPQFETFINKYLFPKINETALINVDLGNRFDFLAKEIDFIGQYSEEYVILDSVPVTLNLSKNEELMLKRNYPRMATKLYGSGIVKKQKFTLNNNDVRFNFSTIGDAVSYAMGVLKKKISDINVTEEREIRAMMIDYGLTQDVHTKTVTSLEELYHQVFESILNIQNNSSLYNESTKASGGAIGRYTTQTKLKNVAILTTDKTKTYLLDTKIANTFQTAGLDPSQRIMSFDELGGVFKATEDFTITEQDSIDFLRTMGDYQVALGDMVPKDSVFTYDVSALKEFKGKVIEIKPESDIFAFVFDINTVRYRRNTKGMLKTPFENPEFDEVTHWLHYYSFKAISPFYNKVVIKEG